VYPTRKFSKASHLINPFSWGTYVQNDLASIDIGVNSQDILSTTSIGLGYRYDLNERTGLWRAGVSYQGLYPIIDVEFTQGKRSFDEGKFRTVVIAEDTTTYFNDVVFKWTEQNIQQASLYLTTSAIPMLLISEMIAQRTAHTPQLFAMAR
jgi:hypothetical protein